jgi:actin-related protein
MEPEEHPIMVAKSWIAPDVARATTMARILFENFNVPAMSVANQVLPPFAKPFTHPLQSASHCRQQVLAAVGTGRPTALVVDIGNDDTHIIPVVQGTTHSM